MAEETGLAKIQNRARDKVRSAFAEVFTDQELDQMLKQEIDNFFNKPSGNIKLTERKRTNSYGTNVDQWVTDGTETTCSPFQLIVWEYCSSVVKEHLYEVMDKPDLETSEKFSFTDTDPNTQNFGFPVTEVVMGKIIQEKAQSLVDLNINKMFQQMFAGYLHQTKADMRMEFEQRFADQNQTY